MRKAIYDESGFFLAALHDSIETDLPFIYVEDDVAQHLTSRHKRESDGFVIQAYAIKEALLDARETRLHEVATELNRRLYLPCNGFDADKVSRERISGMIARLQRGDGLPAGWMGWRDTANEMQWVTDDAATVLANLTALSRAIEDREQTLLIASWTHKANIEALTDIDAILAYDVTKNWPT